MFQPFGSMLFVFENCNFFETGNQCLIDVMKRIKCLGDTNSHQERKIKDTINKYNKRGQLSKNFDLQASFSCWKTKSYYKTTKETQQTSTNQQSANWKLFNDSRTKVPSETNFFTIVFILIRKRLNSKFQ